MSGNSSTGSSSQGKVINIQPSQASVLVQALKKEMELAKAAGNDKEKAKVHYAKAEKINQILLNYQAQQKARQELQGSQVGSPIDPTSGTNSGVPSAQPSAMNSPKIQSQLPNPLSDTTSAGGNGNGNGKSSVITVQKLNQVKTTLEQLAQSIKQLEESKVGETNQQKIETADKEIAKLRPKLAQFQKIAQYFKNDLANQSKSNSSSPVSTPTPGSTQDIHQNAAKPASRMNTDVDATQQDIHKQAMRTNSTPNFSQMSVPGSGLGSAPKPGIPAALNKPKPVGIPSSISGFTRTTPTGILSGPIQTGMRGSPLTTKPLIGGSRPVLSGGIGSSLGYSLSSPSITRMPYEYSHITPTSIPDNSGRVLTKRRLAELANTIGATEGDSKTTIDNDVEDLLLDLADEFVSSVTGFACKIAKHRKVDKVDLKDFQLHLERNWNIQIPGITLDDVKPPRRWQPTSEYSERQAEVDATKPSSSGK
ncbi:uncharacterized protein CANTADRAFT_26297, partial [Suhomyces tanzawaensis NRRL Y-17324]